MSTAADRVTAPFGARMVPVIGRERHGPYIVLGCADTAGPRPAAGQFYMVMASRWGGGDGERPFLPRAFSVLRAACAGSQLQFLVEDVGPGTKRLCSALSLINTVPGMSLHPRTGAPWLGGETGGISGPAVRAVALAQSSAVCQAVRIPVIGMGGVQSGRDAHDLIAVGATVVAVGTESFRDPAAGTRIAAELEPRRLNSKIPVRGN